MSENVGFIGLGSMGQPMASNLLKAGYSLKVYNRSANKADSFAEKNGIDRSALIDMLTKTLFTAPVYQNYGRMIAEKRHTPVGFQQKFGLKDVNLVLETAKTSQVPMPLASLLHDRLLSGVAKGRGDMDWSALSLDVLENAGL